MRFLKVAAIIGIVGMSGAAFSFQDAKRGARLCL
jgi:hypothetical protein